MESLIHHFKYYSVKYYNKYLMNITQTVEAPKERIWYLLVYADGSNKP